MENIIEENAYKCSECGSRNILEKAWTFVNMDLAATRAPESVGDGDYYCIDCDSHDVDIVNEAWD